jgi:CHAT domain-containing protein
VSGTFGTFLRGHALASAENPFLRSGIALAGVNAWSANVPVPEEMGDGLLNAAEVARLDLRDTELVVLSACSTALGDVHAGDGVAGLLQGLRLAGARTIVAALWQIPDEATAQLMEAFYRALIEQPRQAVPEALKTAQSALRKTGKPAWQWAAHVCYGDPAPLTYVPTTGTTNQ